MKTSLVTGGAGFIGSYLVEGLCVRGDRCVVVDTLLHNSYDHLASVSNKISFHRVDITDMAALSRVFQEERPDSVYHLAAHHFIPFCDAHPTEAIRVNVIGTQNVADACEASKVKSVFFASTAAVYGPSETPHNEADPVNPIDIYGVCKVAGEKIMSFMHSRTGIPTVLGRLFNAVGTRETNAHVIPEIMAQLTRTRPHYRLELGNIFPKRDYIFAGDIAGAAMSLLESDRVRSGGLYAVNIGTGEQHSVEDLVKILEQTLDSPIDLKSSADRRRKVERPYLCADTSRLKSFGFAPRQTLRATIHEIAAASGLAAPARQP